MTHERLPEPSDSGVAADELRSFVERIERVNEDIKARNEDKKDIFAEVKSRGFDTGAVKEIVKLRAKDPAERQEREAILDLYKTALGMS